MMATASYISRGTRKDRARNPTATVTSETAKPPNQKYRLAKI